MNIPLVLWPKSFQKLYSCKLKYCTYARRADEGDLCEVDGGDLCEADYGKLVTAHSQTPQLPRGFSEASYATKMCFFLAASLVKVKELQTSPSLTNVTRVLRRTPVTFVGLTVDR